MRQKNNDLHTPMALATYLNKWEVVYVLTQRKAGSNDNGSYGDALLIAAKIPLMKICYALLNAGAKQNWYDRDTMNFPLHYAVLQNSPYLVSALIRRDGNDGKNSKAETPSALAAVSMKFECLNAFLQPEMYGEEVYLATVASAKVLTANLVSPVNSFQNVYHKNESNNQISLPTDVMMKILAYAFANLHVDLQKYFKARKKAAKKEAYLRNCLSFCGEFSSNRIGKLFVASDIKKLIQDINDICSKYENFIKKYTKARGAIMSYVSRESEKKKQSNVIGLLVKHNLYKHKPASAASAAVIAEAEEQMVSGRSL